MMRKIWAKACCLIFLSVPSFAQEMQFQLLNYPVTINNVLLKYPFVGGFNNPQLSEADLNNDGILDLVIFDRAGDNLQTFLNNGTANTVDYIHAPEYACHFPVMQEYLVMRDFNQDGAYDIFTSSVAPGRQDIQVYRGYFENNALKFTSYIFNIPGCSGCDPLYIHYPDEDQPGNWNNLPINPGDIPAFDDINGDGDIDIITFEASAGGYVWLLENQSVEMGLGLDNLRFRLETQCWGGFYESGAEECYCDLGSTPDCCAPCAVGGADDRGNLHPGSTIMTFDQEGDGDKEVVLGDVSYSCLNYLENGGTNTKAWMNVQQIDFPSYDEPVYLNVFPAAFYLDLNNDGKKDMIAAPNNPTIGEDRSNIWFYKNTATTGHHFELQAKNEITREMIDLGTVAHPAFADVNGDGLTDLVVGNYGFFTPGVAVNARLTLFVNTGTPTAPQFELADSDWLGMSEFTTGDYDFSPTFGDIDSDGALDVIVGSNIGGVYCYRNSAGPGEAMVLTRDQDVMWVLMDVVGSVSTPFLYDVDQDGLIDLLIGERTGFVNYFRNNGTATEPLFPAVPTFGKVGQIDTRLPVDAAGYCAPVVVQTEDGALLVCGAQGGQLEAYFFSPNIEETFVPTDLNWGNIDVGSRSHPALADLDNDGILEMVVGNTRGGLTMYKTVLKDCTTSVVTPQPKSPALKIGPNPAADRVKMEWPGKSGQWRAYNALGQLVASGALEAGVAYLSARNWPSGMYLMEVIAGQERATGKLVRQ
jgi:hypothetical protein